MTGRVIFRSFQDLGRVFAKLCIGAVLHLQNEHTKNKLYVALLNVLWPIFDYFCPKMDSDKSFQAHLLLSTKYFNVLT